jgi:hypothetical protein
MKRLVTSLVVGIAALGAAAPPALAEGARWSRSDSVQGNFSIELRVNKGEKRAVAVGLPVNVALDAITSLTFWRRATAFTAGWSPVVLLGLDLTGDTRYRARDLRWEFSSPGYEPALLRGDTFIQCEAAGPLAGPDGAFVQVNVLTDYNCYHPAPSGIGYAGHYGPLSDYQAAQIDNIPPGATVRMIKIIAGGSPNWQNFRALVDVVEVNGVQLLDEPSNTKTRKEVVTDK